MLSTLPPPFVIAEIGVNHDGSVDRAMQLVDIAKQAGADAVKLQVFRARQLMNPAATFAAYQQSRTDAADPIEMLRRYELPDPALEKTVEAIRAAHLIPLATPFSLEDVATIRRLELPLVKIASPDLVNYPLLQAVAELGKPFLLSTGAATTEEIAETLSWLRGWDASFALLHCVSSYPTPADQTHLSWIRDLAGRFPGTGIGYSDHSTEVVSGALAVAAGATILERHLTYDRRAQGPDHSASSDPAEFAEYVRLARLAYAMLGTGPKRVLPIEQDVRTVSRQSLVAARPLPKGTRITSGDLKVQRPGTGISASELPRVIGRTTSRAVAADQILDLSMLA